MRHDLSAGNGRRAWLEAKRLQIHPEMRLLERGDPGQAHLRGRQWSRQRQKAQAQTTPRALRLLPYRQPEVARAPALPPPAPV